MNHNGMHIIGERKEPFTPEEKQIMDLIVAAHNIFVTLPVTHPGAIQDWVRGIHELQNVLIFRVMQRDYPQQFPSAAKQ